MPFCATICWNNSLLNLPSLSRNCRLRREPVDHLFEGSLTDAKPIDILSHIGALDELVVGLVVEAHLLASSASDKFRPEHGAGAGERLLEHLLEPLHRNGLPEPVFATARCSGLPRNISPIPQMPKLTTRNSISPLITQEWAKWRMVCSMETAFLGVLTNSQSEHV